MGTVKSKCRLLPSTVFHVLFSLHTPIVSLIFGRSLAPKLIRPSSLCALFVVSMKNIPQAVCSSSNKSITSEGDSVLGMDSHGDVSCAGKDVYIESKIEGRKCEVKGFHDSYRFINNLSYLDVLYKYQDGSGQEYLLEVNQALDFTESMTHSILCPNQDQYNGVLIHDVPMLIDQNSDQCISFPENGIISRY